MRTIVASDPQLAHDASALARRIRQEAGVISDVDVLDLLQRLRHDSVGLGLLEPVLSLPGLTDVVVNGPDSCFVDCGQGLQPRDIGFADDAEVRQLATRLAAVAGVRLDDAQPFADGRLTRPDGTRIRLHALLAPPSASGTCISLRVLRQAQTSLEELIANGSIDSSLEHVLRAVVERRASFLVTGGTGSGKTTLLAALLGCVPATERLLIIEDTPELSPNHPHVVTLVSRRANAEGRGEISMSLLLRQALRMRPDRIVVGEIRGAEVVELLAALNTGHDGGAGTVHANSVDEVPARMEALAALGGLDRVALHSQLAAAVHVVLGMERTPEGRRLAHLGVLEGNPVTPQLVWTAEDGPLPGFAQLCSRLGVEP
ncbi:TadA family conjugal transfer-associated ATPase [Corynebacterium sp. c19Ua_109]|uniref:TadA family conjugal transfer-associated ATPase n=2 Tax=Corynebacterium hesseae TaxID=2913502 RepID=A0ABU9UFA4_9CORY|nr:TadA family conjugal transfer-associated ATPase [Corynebacterium hesseae]MCZ9299198.1 TadA family conjugal transfer-associated ATPase [Corynebacterium hesseae]